MVFREMQALNSCKQPFIDSIFLSDLSHFSANSKDVVFSISLEINEDICRLIDIPSFFSLS